MKQIAPCPRCGFNHGWFERRIKSYQQHFQSDGEVSHASDGNYIRRGGKRKYCCECSKDITEIVK